MLTSKHAGLGGIAIAVLATNSAYAEPFLWLPTSRGFAVTCKWTCPAVDGGTYYHNAIDYGTPTNSEIRAAAGGKIVVLVNVVPQGFPGGGGYGNHVRIRHPNGYETRYAHLLPNTITVRVGDRVEAGQLLGKSDNTGKSTGPHLHFEVRDSQGRRVNPYGDPPNYTNGCGTNALWA
ncbi:MAG: M23 family metallopeptidase, partial [Patescibacteria group bacterium]